MTLVRSSGSLLGLTASCMYPEVRGCTRRILLIQYMLRYFRHLITALLPAGMGCLAYDVDMTLRTSDHRPVYASFAVDVRVDGDAITVQQARPEYMEASQVCTVM